MISKSISYAHIYHYSLFFSLAKLAQKSMYLVRLLP